MLADRIKKNVLQILGGYNAEEEEKTIVFLSSLSMLPIVRGKSFN